MCTFHAASLTREVVYTSPLSPLQKNKIKTVGYDLRTFHLVTLMFESIIRNDPFKNSMSRIKSNELGKTILRGLKCTFLYYLCMVNCKTPAVICYGSVYLSQIWVSQSFKDRMPAKRALSSGSPPKKRLLSVTQYIISSRQFPILFWDLPALCRHYSLLLLIPSLSQCLKQLHPNA